MIETERNCNVLINAKSGELISTPMQRLELSGWITPMGASLQVVHRFQVEGAEPVEAIYLAALPKGGMLRRFVVKGEDFSIKSELHSRKKARQKYEEGVAEGHLSVLAEAVPDGMVSISVGQIRPGEVVDIITDMVSSVSLRDYGFRFVFPFTIAPCYHPQASVSCVDGERLLMELPEAVHGGDVFLPEWRVDGKSLHEVSFSLTVEGARVGGISSPSHKLDLDLLPDGLVRASLATGGAVPDGNLVLDVRTIADEPQLFTSTGMGDVAKVEQGDDSKASWTVMIPSSLFPAAEAASTKPGRSVIFLLDRSGSMEGECIEAAKAALKACLSALKPEDSFGLIAFDDQLDNFSKQMVSASTVQRRKAGVWLQGVGARGGTEMEMALRAAERLARLGSEDGDGVVSDVFLITDGQVWGQNDIISQIMKSGLVRVHVLGIGTASQDRFLASLAQRTGGVQVVLHPGEDVAAGALRLFNAAGPVAEYECAIGGDAPVSVKIRSGLPHLATGAGQAPADVSLSDGTRIPFGVVRHLPEGLLGVLDAVRRIDDLEFQIKLLGVSDKNPKCRKIMAQLEQISREYSIMGRAMSLVGVVHRAGDEKNSDSPRQVVVPVGLPGRMPGGLLSGQPQATPLGLGVMGFGGFVGAVTSAVIKRSLPPAGVCSSYNEFLSSGPCFGAPMCSEPASAPKPGRTTPEFVLELLGFLDSDGGLMWEGTDDTRERRVARTALFSLFVLQMNIKAGGGLYDAHLERMRGFLLANATAGNGLAGRVAQIIEIGVMPPNWREPKGWKELVSIKGRQKVSKQRTGQETITAEKIWAVIESAI